MSVALSVHAGQGFAAMALALLYLTCFTALFIIGPDSYSVDRLIWK